MKTIKTWAKATPPQGSGAKNVWSKISNPDRKEKLEVLGDRHVVLSNDDDTTPADAKPEETAALGELESVFSAASLPVEFYQEVLHSTSALGVVDASPGQGEMLKACLLQRLPVLAVCGTEGHSKKLEIAMTEFVFQEQLREGSTFYNPEMSLEKEDENADEENQKDAKAEKAKTKPVTKPKPRPPKKGKDDKEQEEKEPAEDKKRPGGTDGEKPPAKKPKKKTGKEAKEDEEDGGSDSSMAWWVSKWVGQAVDCNISLRRWRGLTVYRAECSVKLAVFSLRLWDPKGQWWPTSSVSSFH